MTSDGTTIVLGWDALDFELLQEFDLVDAFGPHCREIETYENESLGEPHTWELWPSLITGLPADEHGIVHASEGGGMDWENPAIRTVADVASRVVPRSVRTDIGRWLRNRGAGVEQRTPEYYEKNDLETVFDDRTARTVSIPNYYTSLDADLGVSFDRSAIFAEYVEKHGTEGGETWVPTVSQSALEARVAAELHRRVGIVRAAIERDYDIVWVWFGFLDTVGHLEPALEDPFQRRAYEQAAEITSKLREAATSQDTIVSVSDHGLQNGAHTHSPVFAATDDALVDDVGSVLDVAEAIDGHAKQSADSPGVREPWRYATRGEAMATDEVRDSLENLGYL